MVALNHSMGRENIERVRAYALGNKFLKIHYQTRQSNNVSLIYYYVLGDIFYEMQVYAYIDVVAYSTIFRYLLLKYHGHPILYSKNQRKISRSRSRVDEIWNFFPVILYLVMCVRRWHSILGFWHILLNVRSILVYNNEWQCNFQDNLKNVKYMKPLKLLPAFVFSLKCCLHSYIFGASVKPFMRTTIQAYLTRATCDQKQGY